MTRAQWHWPGPARSVRAALVDWRLGQGREVLEPGQVLEEGQLDAAGRAIAVLGHDDLGQARLVVDIIVVGSMEQEHNVGVLLDGPGLAKVGHAGPAVLAALHGPVELGQGNHRHVQLAPGS